MDPYLKAALLGATSENLRAHGQCATLNSHAVEVIPSEQVASFPIADGGFSDQATLDFLISAKDWKRFGLPRLSANVLVVDGERYRIKNAHIIPGQPVVRLNAQLPTT